MSAYEPGDSLAHRFDPRSKLAFQVGFAVAAVAHGSVPWLAASFTVAVGALATARLSPVRAIRATWPIVLVLGLGPLLGGVTLGEPWFRVGPAISSLRSVLRIVPILFVSAAFVHATPARDVRAAIQWAVPGRFGRLLGVGVGLTSRLLPAVGRDVASVRAAVAARGGEVRPFYERAGLITALSVRRTIGRADALALALRSRAFSYNPTLPALQFRAIDVPVLVLAVLLALSPLASAGVV